MLLLFASCQHYNADDLIACLGSFHAVYNRYRIKASVEWFSALVTVSVICVCLLVTPMRVAGVKLSFASVCVCVCVCCLHDRIKTAETTVTKLATGIVHYECMLSTSDSDSDSDKEQGLVSTVG